ncbi:MAG: cell division protein ZapA [Proteobacteria bacterium]|nr:cell division protein ZapA [Pseudomonadota bacterium]MBI3496524.1 cell division protein ZapA [Pseudomonadota bacterium]
MGQITIDINGRPYRVACADGEEPHLEELGRYVNAKVKQLVAQAGQIGDTRLLVMASLVIADELGEAKGGIDKPAAAKPADGEAMAAAIEAVAARIESLAARLEGA